MFAVVAIGLAVLSVYFWRQEAGLFLDHMQAHYTRRGRWGFLTGTLSGLPKLAPLALDIGITVSIVTIFGLGGGILGAVVGLAMSNAVSFFIHREVRKYTRPTPTVSSQAAGETPPPRSNPITGAWRAYETWWWDQLARAMRRVQTQEGDAP